MWLFPDWSSFKNKNRVWWYWYLHDEDKMIVRSSYLYDENVFTGKRSQCWDVHLDKGDMYFNLYSLQVYNNNLPASIRRCLWNDTHALSAKEEPLYYFAVANT